MYVDFFDWSRDCCVIGWSRRYNIITIKKSALWNRFLLSFTISSNSAMSFRSHQFYYKFCDHAFYILICSEHELWCIYIVYPHPRDWRNLLNWIFNTMFASQYNKHRIAVVDAGDRIASMGTLDIYLISIMNTIHYFLFDELYYWHYHIIVTELPDILFW